MNNKAVLNLVTLLLILLIVILGPIVIFRFVVPLVREGLSAGSACLDPRLTINTKSGYTCYDASSREARVQVKRGSGEYELAAIQILVSVNGNTDNAEIKDNLVNANEESVYSFTLNSSLSGEPGAVAITPVILKGGLRVVCGITSRASLTRCL